MSSGNWTNLVGSIAKVISALVCYGLFSTYSAIVPVVSAQDDDSSSSNDNEGAPVHVIYFTGSQFSNNSADGGDYYTSTYMADPKIYTKNGPRCCNTGISANGQKLTSIPDVVRKYSLLDSNTLVFYSVHFTTIPSLFEWTEVCQQCLQNDPSQESLWLGTAVALSMEYTSRVIHNAYLDTRNRNGYVPIMVGPTYAIEAQNILDLALHHGFMAIGYSTPDFDRSTRPDGYANFYNIVPNHDYPFKAASTVLNHLQWYNQLTIVFVNETWSSSLANNIYDLLEYKDSVYLVQVEEEYYSMSSAITNATTNTDANRIIVLIGRNTQKTEAQAVIQIQNPVYSMMCLLAKTSFNVHNQNALVILPEQGDDLLVSTNRSCYVNRPGDQSDCDCDVEQINNVNF